MAWPAHIRARSVVLTDRSEARLPVLDISRPRREFVERERLAAIRASMFVFAHEVGNKLNNLSLHVQMLDRALREENHPLSRRSQRVRAEIRALCELLEEFEACDLNREVEPSSVDLLEVLDEVCELEAEPIADVRVVKRAPSNVYVLARRDDLTQIVSHLFRNALDAMPEGGTLTLTVSEDDRDVILTVEDTGAGIAPDADVFKPFHTDKTDHLGLGLSFVRHLVKAQGGSIRHESELGQGARFIVTLPASVDHDPR